jgi:4-amino-4-deoxy-L-arabinose transferase-like glycosyltransferase
MIVLDELREAWRSESNEHRLVLTTIFSIAIALRVMYIAQPMRYDEAVTYMYFVRLPWSDALSTYTYPNNHIFHTALAKAAVTAFGNHPWAIRIPAFLAGILVLPAAYVVVRELYGARAALLASALLSTSAVLIMFSTNARGYMLMVLGFLLLVLVSIHLLRGGPRMLWTQFAVIAALGLWTIPSMLYPFAAVCLWLALSFLVDGKRAELRQLWIAIAVTAGLTALLYWPVAANDGIAAVTRNRFVLPSPWFLFLAELPKTIGEAVRSWGLGLPPVVALALVWPAFAALRRHGSLTPFRVGLPVAMFASSCWILVVNHRAPFARTWIWVFPVVAALIGAGIVVLLERWPRLRPVAERRVPAIAITLTLITSVSVVSSFSVLLTRDTGTYREAEDAAAVFKRVLRPGDRILAAIPTNGPLDYYLNRAGIDRRHLSQDERSASRIFAVVDQGEGQTLSDVVMYSVVRDTSVWAEPSGVVELDHSAIIVFQRKNAAPK